MEIIEFNKKNNSEIFECKNIEELIKNLELVGNQHKKVVCKIKIDEKFLDETEEFLLHNMSVKNINKIEVHLSDSSDLVFDTLKNVINLIDSILNSTQDVIDFEPETKEFEEKLGLVVNKSYLLMESLSEVYRVGVTNRLLKHMYLWRSCEAEFNQMLQFFTISIECKRWNDLKNILRYDFSENLISWQELLERELHF